MKFDENRCQSVELSNPNHKSLGIRRNRIVDRKLKFDPQTEYNAVTPIVIVIF